MATTTNYGWDTPDDTDLVKDGAAAIRTLGSSIDTTTKNLNPQTTTGALAYRSATANINTALPIGTAGQILAVSGGVPAWINNDQGDITEVQAGVGISVASGTGPIPIITNSSTDLITTAGDLLYGTAADTVARLGIGTANQVLRVNSGATAPEWATPSSGALTLITQASFDNPNVSVSNCFSTTYENYLILINCSIDNATARQVFLRFLDSGGSEYSSSNYYGSAFGYKTSGATLQQTQGNGVAQINFPVVANGPTPTAYFAIQVQRKASTNGTYPSFTGTLFNSQAPTDSNAASYTIGGMFDSSNTVYGFKFYNGTYNVAGQYRVYGYQKS